MMYVYRKTFWVMQAIILMVAVAVFAWSRALGLALVFFTAMQASSFIGAIWGSRLRRKVLNQTQRCDVGAALS